MSLQCEPAKLRPWQRRTFSIFYSKSIGSKNIIFVFNTNGAKPALSFEEKKRGTFLKITLVYVSFVISFHVDKYI